MKDAGLSILGDSALLLGVFVIESCPPSGRPLGGLGFRINLYPPISAPLCVLTEASSLGVALLQVTLP